MYDHMMLTAINPQAASNFLDEDHMKVMRSVGKACHPATAKTKWANRYIVKKAITWMRMQNEKRVRQNKCILMCKMMEVNNHNLLLMAEILHQLIGSFPIICKVFTSQVVQDFSHQQYQWSFGVAMYFENT